MESLLNYILNLVTISCALWWTRGRHPTFQWYFVTHRNTATEMLHNIEVKDVHVLEVGSMHRPLCEAPVQRH